MEELNLRLGSNGQAVFDIQRRLKKLNYKINEEQGFFGKETENAVKQFQQDRGLLIDGIVGEETWQDLVEASYILGERTIYLKNPHLRGDDIKTIQLWLRTVGFNPGPIDGIFGKDTEKALKIFQENCGHKSDGIVGSETVESFLNLKTTLERNATIDFPQQLIDPHSSLAGLEKQTIIIDYAHGGKDKGAVGPTRLIEANVCEDIGLRVGNLFKILGTRIFYTKMPGQSKTTAERIDFINHHNARLVVSIHMNHSISPKGEGSCCYYFASGSISSTEGAKIAKYIQQKQISTLNLKDCRTHGKSFNILRLTKIPAVIVEPAFITNPREEELLRKTTFKQQIATAIFDGIKTYLNETLAD